MGRRSSSGGYSGRSTFRTAPACKPASHAPPPAPVSSSRGRSFFSSIREAVGWGIGNAVGHRAVEAVLGPHTFQIETVVSQATSDSASTPNSAGAYDVCSNHNKAFQDCLNTSESEISKCQFYMDMLQECRQNAKLNA